jgi:hypothetical protein
MKQLRLNFEFIPVVKCLEHGGIVAMIVLFLIDRRYFYKN